MAAARPPSCPVCRKKIWKTEELARRYLATLLSSRRPFHKPGAYAVKPYACPVGSGWHVGRDHNTLMIDFKKGRTKNVGKLAHQVQNPNRVNLQLRPADQRMGAAV